MALLAVVGVVLLSDLIGRQHQQGALCACVVCSFAMLSRLCTSPPSCAVCCGALQINLWSKVESAFGRTGIPSFLLEGVLGELQAASSRHLAHLAAGMTLELSATSSRKSASAGARAKEGRAAALDGSLLAANYGSSSSSTARPLASVAAGSVLSSSSSSSMGSASVDTHWDEVQEEVSSAKAKKGPGPRKGTSTAGAGAVKEEISKVVRVQGAQALMQHGDHFVCRQPDHTGTACARAAAVAALGWYRPCSSCVPASTVPITALKQRLLVLCVPPGHAFYE